MFENLRNKGKALSEKAKDSQIVTSVQSLLDEHWSTLETKLVHGFLSVAEEKLYDEGFVETTLEKSYELLPTAVRLIISRKRFMSFANSKSGILRQKVTEARQSLDQTNSVLGLSLEMKDNASAER